MLSKDPIRIAGPLGRIYSFTRHYQGDDFFEGPRLAFHHDRAYARDHLLRLTRSVVDDPFNYRLLDVWQLVFQKPWTRPRNVWELVTDLTDKIHRGELFVYLEPNLERDTPSLVKDGPGEGEAGLIERISEQLTADQPRVSGPKPASTSASWGSDYWGGLSDTASAISSDIAAEQTELYENTSGWGNVMYPVFKPIENFGTFIGNTFGLMSALSPKGMNPKVAEYWRGIGDSVRALGGKVVDAVGGDGRAAGEITPAVASILVTKKVPDVNKSGLDKLVPDGQFSEGLDVGASAPFAAEALGRKLSALEDAQRTAMKIETLADGRVLYIGPEKPARNPGPTRGAALVTEHNPTSGQVRQYYENYNHDGSINRVHPKMIDGQVVDSIHYPPTKRELEGN